MTFRRTIAVLAAILVVLPLAACQGATKIQTTPTTTPVPGPALAEIQRDADFAALEKDFDAHLGVYAVDTGSGRSIAYRADARFAFASTFKALAAGVVLEQGGDLGRVIRFSRSDLVANSPVTSQHVDSGMSVQEILDAAVCFSDNTAGNLMFAEIGGPAGYGAALAQIGDTVTRPSRRETDLNLAVPGDFRDTSTARALAGDLREFALGDALPKNRRAILVDLLQRNTTGATLVRAGVPNGWVVGDKSGGGRYGTRNDIALVWPPDRAPIVIAVLSSRDAEEAVYDDALVAGAARVVLGVLE